MGEVGVSVSFAGPGEAGHGAKERSIRAFVRGRSRMLFSSGGLGWTGLLMEQHELVPGAWPESELSGVVLCYWNNTQVLRCDHPDAYGRFVPKLIHPGTLSVYTTGTLPTLRPSSRAHLLLCAFDADLALELPEDLRSESNMRSLADGLIAQDMHCFMDAPLREILERLGAEAEGGGRLGPLYADRLIRSLRARLLALIRGWGGDAWRKNRMDLETLRWLSELLERSAGRELDLETLASDRGCSKRHLLRSFRARTGQSPHQYILDLRMEMARRLMLRSGLSLMDIAMECGFRSQGHFTSVFHQRLGVPPSSYRRRL